MASAPVIGGPLGGVIIDIGSIQHFTWTPDVTIVQSAFDIQYRVIGAPGWTTVSSASTNRYYDFPVGTFTSNNYEWQVRNYNAGVVGPFSASSTFTAAVAIAGKWAVLISDGVNWNIVQSN